MRTLFKAIVATAALAAPFYANAIPVTWNYSGVCTKGDCDVVSSISGSLTGDAHGDGQLNEVLYLLGDLTSYNFTLRNSHGVTYSFDGVHGDGTYYLNGAGDITGGSMTFANLFSLEFLTGDAGAGSWSIVDCRIPIFCFAETEASGRGSYTRATSVPEPATLSLLGLGLLGFGLVRRRRR
jgi:hypothetical protein